MIDEQSIENIKTLTNVVEVVGDYVKLKKKGADFVGLCPFHNEKSPSFTVSPSKQIYKCFGCGESGDAISFVMKHENVSFVDAITQIAARYGIEVENIRQKDFVKPTKRLQKVGDKMLAYFEGRGISNNTLLRFGITESKEWMPQEQAEVPVICFNYHREGELINIKFRSAKKGFKFEKDAELIFYNLDSVKGQKSCYVVEGEIDALSLYEAGIYNVISVPNGASAKQMPFLDSATEYFKDMEEIIIMSDNDAPGRELREELARRFGYPRCKHVVYPSGCKDANDVLVKHGKDKLAEVCVEAVDFEIDGVLGVFDMVDQIVDFYDNGYPNGYTVFMPGLKDNINWQLMLGQFTTVTGIPGSGKSEWTDWLMVLMARHHGWKWAIYSPENQPESIHVTKLLEKVTGKSFAHRKDLGQRMNREELADALYFLSQHFYFVKIKDDTRSLNGVMSKVEEMIFKYGIKGFLIDPWNKLELGSAGSETQTINRGLSTLSMFCKSKTVHGIVIAHPTKIPKIEGTKKYQVPTLYNISGSANWYNQTDNGVVVYRDRETGIVSVYFQKIRFAWLGNEGHTNYTYNTYTRQYEVSADSPKQGPALTPVAELFIQNNFDEEAPF